VLNGLDRRAFLRRMALVLGVGTGGALAGQPRLVGAYNNSSEDRHKPGRIGALYVPRLRSHVWNMPIFDGVEDRHLDRGVGRISGAAGPGEWGNFAIAGHRTKAVRPFYYIERLRKNDDVIVRTPIAWFTYRLLAQQIVTPRESWVIDPAPFPTQESALAGTSRILTIVTCTPRGTTEKRWIWWGHLTAVHPADTPPAPIN